MRAAGARDLHGMIEAQKNIIRAQLALLERLRPHA
jgi:hypothetical protein